MANTRLTDKLKELRFTSNKIDECLGLFEFDSLERRKLREAMDILDNKVFEWEDIKNESIKGD
nr:MAG TPA: autophagy-related protein [Caudoviricetes sp.]